MIPESLKMGHWLGEEPLPFAFSRSPRVQKANKGHKIYLGFEHDPQIGDMQCRRIPPGYGSVFLQSGAPTSHK